MPPPRTRTKVGLVLGAGGVVGQAYHAGLLSGLLHDTGWDARSASYIVGTSAGSIVGALLSGGILPFDLAAWTVQASQSLEEDVLERLFGAELPQLPPWGAASFLGRPHLPSADMLRHVVRRPWSLPMLALWAAILPDGKNDMSPHVSALRSLPSERWHEGRLLVAAMRRCDGAQVFFGQRPEAEVPLERAVAASCAIPTYFSPVSLGGEEYVDGGMHSPTNAAALANLDLDEVVIVSPMSGHSGSPRLMGVVRRYASHVLRREIRALRSRDIRVRVYEPSSDAQDAMGSDLLRSEDLGRVVREAFLDAGRARRTQ